MMTFFPVMPAPGPRRARPRINSTGIHFFKIVDPSFRWGYITPTRQACRLVDLPPQGGGVPLGLSLILTFFFLFFTHIASASEKPFLPIKEIHTPKGLIYWLIEDHAQALMSLQFGFQGAGSVNETSATQGLARLLSNTLDEGAGPYNSRAFQAELENNAIQLSFGQSRDHFFGTLKTLTTTRDHAGNLLRLALSEPRFDQEAVSRMIDANLTRIRSSLPDPDWLAARLMNDKIFGDHPYHLNSGGTLSTLPTLTPDTLRNFKNTYLTQDRLKIAIVGDVTPDQASQMIDHIFSNLPALQPLCDRCIPITDAPNPSPAQGKTYLYKKDIPQTIVMMSIPAPPRGNDDEASFMVLDNIFGSSGFGSRLMEEIREKSGLTYGIYSNYSTLDRASQLTIQASTKNETAALLIEKTRNEMAIMQTKPITTKELGDAKGYLLGSMATALGETSSIAGLLLNLQLDHRKIDAIDTLRANLRAVTIADVTRVAQKWLDPKGLSLILVGNPGDVADAELVQTINNIE